MSDLTLPEDALHEAREKKRNIGCYAWVRIGNSTVKGMCWIALIRTVEVLQPWEGETSSRFEGSPLLGRSVFSMTCSMTSLNYSVIQQFELFNKMLKIQHWRVIMMLGNWSGFK